MAVHIVHWMPDGSGIVETRVGETLGGITAFSTYELAEEAGMSVLSDSPNRLLLEAAECGRAERRQQNPYAMYENMSYPRLFLLAIKSLRFGRP